MAPRDDELLIAYQLDQPLPPIRPGAVRRDWMEASPNGFAYRCLPLTMANGHGWEVLGQTGFEASWNGGAAPEDVAIRVTHPGAMPPASHFGSGILTFPIPVLLRTPPGIGLWVSGPPNAPKDGIAALSGLVETDWAPMTFTMNWRFTRPDQVVRFRPHEPICFFFPLSLGLAEAMRPESRALDTAPEEAAAYRAWQQGRDAFNAALKEAGSAAQRQGWQRHYHRGEAPDGRAAPSHRTRLRLRPFPAPPR